MKERFTTVTRRGQVTVPQEIREALGLRQGDKVVFLWDDGEVRLKPSAGVATRTAGALSRYARHPALTAEEERAAFEQAVADQVMERMGSAGE